MALGWNSTEYTDGNACAVVGPSRSVEDSWRKPSNSQRMFTVIIVLLLLPLTRPDNFFSNSAQLVNHLFKHNQG
jgi:hypothetical protein